MKVNLKMKTSLKLCKNYTIIPKIYSTGMNQLKKLLLLNLTMYLSPDLKIFFKI